MAEVPTAAPRATRNETPDTRTFSTYEDAAQEAARIGCNDGLLAKVQRSPYGEGFVVQTMPVEFFLRPELKQIRPIGYREL